jgi:hypothetical protein
MKNSIGPDHLLTFPAEPTGSACRTQTGTFSLDSTSYVVTTTDQTTRTISSSTTSTSVTWTACAATNAATSTAATSTAACALLPTSTSQPVKPRQITDPPQPGSIDPSTVDFACEGPSNMTYMIYIKASQWSNQTAVSEVEDLLERRKSQNSRGYDKVEGSSHVWQFNAHNMHVDVAKVFATLLAVDGMPDEDFELKVNEHRAVPERSTRWEEDGSRVFNASAPPKPVFGPALPLDRRAVYIVPHGEAWHLSHLSVPAGVAWRGNTAAGTDYVRQVWAQGPNGQPVYRGETYHGYWDDSYGQEQWVYIWEDDVYRGHRVRPLSRSSLVTSMQVPWVPITLL